MEEVSKGLSFRDGRWCASYTEMNDNITTELEGKKFLSFLPKSTMNRISPFIGQILSDITNFLVEYIKGGLSHPVVWSLLETKKEIEIRVSYWYYLAIILPSPDRSSKAEWKYLLIYLQKWVLVIKMDTSFIPVISYVVTNGAMECFFKTYSVSLVRSDHCYCDLVSLHWKRRSTFPGSLQSGLNLYYVHPLI